MYLKTQRQWIPFFGKLNASAGDTWNSHDAPGTKWNSGKKKAIWSHYPIRWTPRAKSLRAQFGGTTTWGNLTTRRLWQWNSVEFGVKICKLEPNIKLRFILLWRRQRHGRSYVYCVFGSLSAQCWARRIALRCNEYFEKIQNPTCHLPRPGTMQIQTQKFLFMISIRSQQCNYSIKTPAILLLHQLCSKRGYSYEWKTAKLHNWPQMGRQLLVLWTTQYFSLYQDRHNIPAAFLSSTSRWKDQSNYSRKLGTLTDPVQTRSDTYACGKPMLTDHAKQVTGNREPANEMNKEDPTQGIPVWLQPSTVDPEDLERCARTFLWKSELRFGRWRFKSGDAKKEAQCSCLLPQKAKEAYSAIGKVCCLVNSRAQHPQRRTWISEQSPIRCRGTSSRHSVESVSNQNLTGDGEEFTKVPISVAQAKMYSYVQFIRIWQVCE